MKTTMNALHFFGASRRASHVLRLALPLVAVLLIQPLHAQAGVISSVNSVSGTGLGTVNIPAILTINPNNDNQVGGGSEDNNITVPIKRFDHAGYIDIEFNVTASDGVTEYQVSETLDNNTGIDWSQYTMVLGFGTGANFVMSASGDGLDFDAPFYDALPTSGAFSNVSLSEDILVYSNGVHGSGFEIYTLRIDVPDGITQFTLRQFPTLVPEPATIALAVTSLLGLAMFARRRQK